MPKVPFAGVTDPFVIALSVGHATGAHVGAMPLHDVSAWHVRVVFPPVSE